MFAVFRGEFCPRDERSRRQANHGSDSRVVAVQSRYHYAILGTNRGDELAGRRG
jgi:hypothetical protein